MNEKVKCPRCGAQVPEDAPEGLCLRCLGRLNLEPETLADDTAGAVTWAPPPTSELAPLFPQLELLSFIGRGGMGAVYKARQKGLERIVALKILPPGIGDDPAFAQRFAREAKALARLNHPGIPAIHDFGRAENLFYFVMEFVDGVSLRQLMHTGRVSPREALAIVPQICDALQYAHDQGLVHRDIKPENILLDRQGRVKVADFGLVKLMEGLGELPHGEDSVAAVSPNLTQAGKMMGTPQYMAPEQAEHPAGVDHRADIYALGVVLYQMLTGELPGQPLEPPSKKLRLDVRLDEVVLRALEKEPERRYQQASQVKTAMESLTQEPARTTQANESLTGPKRSIISEDSRPRAVQSRSRRIITVALLSLGIASALCLLWVARGRHPGPQVNGPGANLAILSASQASQPAAEAGGQPADQQGSTTATFGPVIERTLRLDGNECDFLVLRTGKLLRHACVDGDIYRTEPPTAFMQWALEQGVDIGFCPLPGYYPSTNHYGLSTLEVGTYQFPYELVPLKNIPTVRSEAEMKAYWAHHPGHDAPVLMGPLVGVTNIWKDLTATQLLDPPEGPEGGPAFFLKEKRLLCYPLSTNREPPIAFVTHDGVRGLLQITSFTENPPTLKLRYKLVQ